MFILFVLTENDNQIIKFNKNLWVVILINSKIGYLIGYIKNTMKEYCTFKFAYWCLCDKSRSFIILISSNYNLIIDLHDTILTKRSIGSKLIYLLYYLKRL